MGLRAFNSASAGDVEGLSFQFVPWTPKVCKIMAFMAVIMGLGLFCYTLTGLRYL